MNPSNIFQRISQAPTWLISLVALCSGVLVPLALAPFNIWPLAIIAIAFLGLLINGQNFKNVMWRTWMFGIGMYAVGVSWVYVSISGFGGAPIPLALLLVLIFVLFLAAVFTLPFYIYGRWLSPHRLNLVLVLPIIWLLNEWLRTWLLTGFPWLFVGYSQLHTWLAGWAPLFGVLGLSLICAFSGGLLAELLNGRKVRNPVTLSSIGIIIALWSAGFCLQKIDWTQASTEPTSLAIVQPNIAQEDKWQEVEILVAIWR